MQDCDIRDFQRVPCTRSNILPKWRRQGTLIDVTLDLLVAITFISIRYHSIDNSGRTKLDKISDLTFFFFPFSDTGGSSIIKSGGLANNSSAN